MKRNVTEFVLVIDQQNLLVDASSDQVDREVYGDAWSLPTPPFTP